eukprot:m51a1_g4751 hypothetical protein (279) ;mRNA; r:409821-411204
MSGGSWRNAFWEACKGDKDVAGLDTDTSWDVVEWSADRARVARELVAADPDVFSPELRDKYEREAGEHWERFYAHFEEKFFKDRNYLQDQFPELTAAALAPGACVLEVGCGVGNTLLPLIPLLPAARFVGVDISPRAVEIMCARPGWDPARCAGAVADVTSPGALAAAVPSGSVNVATAIFALSAVSPAALPVAIAALYDVRFAAKSGRRIEDNFYLRADGTRVHYLTREAATEAFTAAGFTVERCDYDTRELRNRKRAIRMYRVWVTGKFVKPLASN